MLHKEMPPIVTSQRWLEYNKKLDDRLRIIPVTGYLITELNDLRLLILDFDSIIELLKLL